MSLVPIHPPKKTMAMILFMPFHWASDMNPSFVLARKLRDRGHRVHYLGIPDIADRIRSQGFDLTPVFSRAFPEGALAKQYESEAQGKLYDVAEFMDRFRGTCEQLRGRIRSRHTPTEAQPFPDFEWHAVGRNCGLQNRYSGHLFFQHLDLCRGLCGSSVQQ